MSAADDHSRRRQLERALARLSGVVAVSVVALSAGLLAELNSQARAKEIPAAFAPVQAR